MRIVRVAVSSALLGLLFLSTVSRIAAQPAPSLPFAGQPFTATVADLRSASAAMPPSKDYGAQVIYEEGLYRIAADGTLKYRHRLIYRVDTEAAVHGWAENSASWDPWYENPVQLDARVLQPDGSFAVLDQKTVTDAPVKADDNETYSSRHMRRAPLPGMAVGAIVEEMQTFDGKAPYFSNGELYRFYFSDNVPVGRERLIVELPDSLPFKDQILQLPGLSVTRTVTDGTRRVVYEATSVAASHDSDIDLATNSPLVPRVEFATGKSWAQVAAGYAALADPQTVTSEAQAVLPQDLPAERMARIQAIVKILHHEVRYTGVEFGSAELTPQHPAAVLERHYGDCKDKATLLVAMLRAAGIQANLALLTTGPGLDVDPTLPGINRFDHAIVYVPAGKRGEDPLWIDATAEYFAVGSLPFEDQGRYALVIAPGATGLTRIPDPKPEDSLLVEKRTFTMSELGPSHVEEVSETHGYIDAIYRSDYGGPETPKIQENMESYVKNAYLARKLTRFEHGDSTDFDHPFNLTLDADGAMRGQTALIDALVVIFPSSTANSLPKWFSTQPPAQGPDMSPDAKHDLEIAQQSRPPQFVFRPFITEQRVRILAPAGFTLRSLPPDKTTPLGTASLTESYSAAEPGVVTVSFRFNSGPGTLTADQALALRAAILELDKREYVGIHFDQSGVKALTAGHIREGLDIDRSLIAAAPADAYHRIHLARALLDAGIGSQAQAEARKATELDPKLAAAYETLGWTLEHNALGERFGKGFDLPGAIAAYKRAIELDPDDSDPRFDLAILDEFDARGTRYAPDSDMTSAIQGYKDLIELNKDKGDDTIAQYRENLLYVLLYDKQFAELDKMLATLATTNDHRAMAITSAAAQRGAAAGIAEADHGNNASTDRNHNLRSSGTQLANLHLYAVAADVMSAGIAGDDDATRTARQIELYKSLQTASLAPLPATNPAAPVQLATVGIMAGTLTYDQALAITSRHAYSSPESMDRDTRKGLTSVGFLRRAAEKADMNESVLLDLVAGNTTYSARGDDQHGYDVISQSPGEAPDHTFVVREDGVYRVVAGGKDTNDDDFPAGNEILWSLDHGNPAQAKALLDWKRDLTHREGADDPLAGPLLPRFWTIGSSKPGADSPDAMRLAAISLLSGSMDANPYLAEIAAGRDKATGQRQEDLDLLLAEAAIYAEQPAVGLPAAKRLMDQEPDSLLALSLAAQAYAQLNDPASLQALVTPRLLKKPGDHDLLGVQETVYEIARDFKSAQETQRKVLDSGKAVLSDYNAYAWLGLFHNDLGDDITKAAQQAVQMGNNNGFAELHTLACIYAAQGRTTEAKQVLQDAIDAGSMPEPNSAVWYALGLIYEQYGEKNAALDAYRRVQAHEFDDHTFVYPTSTYVLAQDRIHALAN
jgi:tetratricopeptide (TPR) repeat protein